MGQLMTDPSQSIALLHIGAMAYVVAILVKPKFTRYTIGTAELSALVFALLLSIEAMARRYVELYNLWFFVRNTLGGLGLTWLIFDRIAKARRP